MAADLDHILTHTRELWEELRGQRIFITGGTGFFGCWLLESFAWANDQLGLNAFALVLTRDLDAFRKKAPHLASHPAIQFHSGDVRSFEFAAGTFSHIIHAATEASTRLSDENPLEVFDAIVRGTQRTLDFARHCRARKVLLTSSGAVYGKQPPRMARIPEEYQGAPDPTDPLSAYGEGKRAVEFLSAAYRHDYGLDVKIARCFTFAGRYLNPASGFAITDFVLDALRGGPILVRGDGTARRSYLHGADLAAWLWTILLRGLPIRAYNVGSEESISISELAHAVAEMWQPQPEVRVCTPPSPGQPVECYVPSTRRAREELGLRKTVGLTDALRDTIDWLRQTQPAHPRDVAAVQEYGRSSLSDGGSSTAGRLDPRASRAGSPNSPTVPQRP